MEIAQKKEDIDWKIRKLTKTNKDKYNECVILEELYRDNINDICSAFKSLSKGREVKQKKEVMEKEYQEIKQTNLIKILNGNKYKFKPEMLIDIKGMTKNIEEWLINLPCYHEGCLDKAILTYSDK